jgi:hypothetical protein
VPATSQTKSSGCCILSFFLFIRLELLYPKTNGVDHSIPPRKRIN